MKKVFWISMVFIFIFNFSCVFGAKNEHFDGLTAIQNGVCVAKYGKSISILDPKLKVTVLDTSKARINAKGNKIDIIGTGSFDVKVNNKVVKFFAWNARLESGSVKTFSNVACNKNEKTVKDKVFLSVSKESNVYKINAYLYAGKDTGNLTGRYIKNISKFTTAFEQNFYVSPLVNNKMYVYFLNVGAADGIIIVNNGQVALIDGGHASTTAGKVAAVNKIIDVLWVELGIKKIDYLIGSHNHPDHIECWGEVANKFEIGSVYISKYAKLQKGYQKKITDIFSKNKIKEIGISSAPIKIGQANLGKQVTIKVLAPWDDSKITENAMKENNDIYANAYSLVLLLENGEHSFLLAGDAFEESKTMKFMKNSQGKLYNDWFYEQYADKLDIDVIKLAHHGLNEMPMKLLNKIIPANKKQWIVLTCGEKYAEQLKNGKVYDTRHNWVINKLIPNRPNATFVYTAMRNEYVLFISDGKTMTREYK